MKTKLIAMLLVLAVSLSIAACGSAGSGATAQTAEPDSNPEAEVTEAAPTPSPEAQAKQSRAEKLLSDGESGNGRAYTDLGRMYEKGNGVEQDYEKALEYYRLSAQAKKADFKGMRYAGLMYRDGTGVAQDYAEAAACFRQAAEAGDVSAAYFLGLLYEEGNGVEQSADEAKKCYEKAVSTVDEFLSSSKNKGPDELKLALCRLAEMALAEEDTDTAVAYYQLAAQLGWSEAEEKLSELGVAAADGKE